MYTTLGYLYSQTHNVVVDVGETDRIYRRMYAKPIQLSYGINNPLKFKILNNQQKTVNVSGFVFKFHIMDSATNTLLFEKTLQVEDAIRGIIGTVITEEELAVLDRSEYNYSLSCEVDGLRVPVYVNDNFNTRGNLKVDIRAYPKADLTQTLLINLNEPTEDVYVSNVLFLKRKRFNTTVAIYGTDFVGSITTKSTLIDDSTNINNKDFFITDEAVYDLSTPLNGIYVFNLEGNYTAHKFEINLESGSIEKVLISH